MTSDGSITDWRHQLGTDNRQVAQHRICRRYLAQLGCVARRRIVNRIPRQEQDEEDIAISALATFFRRFERGQFPDLQDRNELWDLLVCITSRKVCRLMERQFAQKRRVNGLSHVSGVTAGEFQAQPVEELASRTPSPDVAVIVTEEIQRLLNCLDEPLLRQIVDRKLEGWPNREIALQCGLSVRTIERKLNRVRVLWTEMTAS